MKNNPQIVEQAKKAVNNFSPDKDGAMQAIQAFGGNAIFEKGINAIKKRPMANFALKGLGIDVDNISKQLTEQPTNVPYAANNTPKNKYVDMLAKLR